MIAIGIFDDFIWSIRLKNENQKKYPNAVATMLFQKSGICPTRIIIIGVTGEIQLIYHVDEHYEHLT